MSKVIWKQMGVATTDLADVVTTFNFQPSKFMVISTPDPLRLIVLYAESEKA